MLQVYLSLVCIVLLVLAYYPFVNWQRVKLWEKELRYWQRWMESHPRPSNAHFEVGFEGKEIGLCTFCETAQTHQRKEKEFPNELIWGFVENRERGSRVYYSFHCVRCGTELYRDKKVKEGELMLKVKNKTLIEIKNELKSQIVDVVAKVKLNLESLKNFVLCRWRTLTFKRPNLDAFPMLTPIPLDRVINFSTPIHIGVKNPERFNQLMEELKTLVDPGFYLGNSFFTWFKNNSLFEDEVFRRVFEQNANTNEEKSNAWGIYIEICLARRALEIPGDFLVVGEIEDEPLKFMGKYYGGDLFRRRTVHLTNVEMIILNLETRGDPFRYLYSEVGANEGAAIRRYLDKNIRDLAYCQINNTSLSILKEVLAYISTNIKHHRGLTIVFNCYENSGAYREQKKIIDDWSNSMRASVVPLPTGQAILVL